MTPQEKAIALYTYYEELIKDFTKGVSINQLAKECALKCVSEILEDKVEVDGMRFAHNPYWLEVFENINKL